MRSFSGALAEECIVLSAVRPHKHGTREEKHISPSWETPGKKKKSNTPLVPSVPHQTNNLTPGHRLPLSFIERRFLKEEM